MEWLSQNWVYLLALAGVVFMMTRGGMGCGMGSHRGRSERGQGGHGSGDRDDGQASTPTTDPVSGRPVDPQAAVATVYRGRNYYVESRENRDRFEAAPGHYAAALSPGHGGSGRGHGGGC